MATHSAEDVSMGEDKKMKIVVSSHRFERMTADMRPQDVSMDGSGLTFTPLEHGGEFPDMMPQAIRVQDAEGRWCIYVPTTEHGKVVRSHGYDFYPETVGSP